MTARQQQAGGFNYGQQNWWMGTVTDRMDPKKLGRLKIRVRGYHTEDEGEIPNDDLPWAMPNQGITSAALSGVGRSPTGLLEGSTVFGYYADGAQSQTPVIVGSLAGIPSDKGQGGFKDPTGKYPKDDWVGEQDVHRLARGEKTDQTIVKKKLDTLDDCQIGQFSPSGSRSEWQEHPTQYAAVYPFNHVFESESGHTTEFDDTAGVERIHQYHRTGTFYEIDPSGKQVEKIVNDNYQIVEGDNYHHVHGNHKSTIDGNETRLTLGNTVIEIAGNCNKLIHGNYHTHVLGDCILEVDGNYTILVGGNFLHQTAGTHTSNTGGDETRTAANIYLN